MTNTQTELAPGVFIGPPPDAAELDNLVKQGFKAILNFRLNEEPEQFLSPENEGLEAAARGIEYRHIAVEPAKWQDKAEIATAELERLPRPVYIHCRSGKRAGLLALTYLTNAGVMKPAQAQDRARALGFEVDDKTFQ